jgi:hypothetical protein
MLFRGETNLVWNPPFGERHGFRPVRQLVLAGTTAPDALFVFRA